MENGVEIAADPMQTVEEIFAKSSWTRQDCRQLYVALYDVNDATDKFRALASKALADNADAKGDAALRNGILLYMLGRCEEAMEIFNDNASDPEAIWFRASCLRNQQRFSDAAEEFSKISDNDFAIAAAQCKAMAGDYEFAEKSVTSLASQCAADPEYHVLRGLVLEHNCLYQQAGEAYTHALEQDSSCNNAAFRMALLADRYGDDETAIEYYTQCMSTPPVSVGAAINLSVIYEDLGQWDQASACLDTILEIMPGHKRARLFLRDVQGSTSMFYDEDQERRVVQRNAVLDIPVTDFELSVRARNCLKKMNINTLGDLMKVTEADLLGSKNFGETSLVEIKAMLTQKGLTLGQDVPQSPTAEPGMLQPEENALLSKPVGEMELSVRARKALERLDIASIGELTTRSEAELLACKNFGQTSLNEIKQRLTELGLSLRTR